MVVRIFRGSGLFDCGSGGRGGKGGGSFGHTIAEDTCLCGGRRRYDSDICNKGGHLTSITQYPEVVKSSKQLISIIEQYRVWRWSSAADIYSQLELHT